MPRKMELNFSRMCSIPPAFAVLFPKATSRHLSNVSARLCIAPLAHSKIFEKTARSSPQTKMKFRDEQTHEVKKWVIERIENM